METLGDWLTVCPWKSRKVCLIAVPLHSSPTQAVTVTDKRELLASPNAAHATLIAVWAGQWSTTARIFTDDDREKVLDALA